MNGAIQVNMGCQDDYLRIGVHWFDHNNENHLTVVQIRILTQDKPRTLVVEACTVPDDKDRSPDLVGVNRIYETVGVRSRVGAPSCEFCEETNQLIMIDDDNDQYVGSIYVCQKCYAEGKYTKE
jgi:hypothetical protein